ncbi:MAG: hypothetical protein ACI4S2_00245 [Lachnospiraceae bacterium]
MKKSKRILALIGAILLIGMYACTLIFALIGSENATSLLMASIACTIIVPVFIYAYMLVYRVLKGRGCEEEKNNHNSEQ